MTDTIVDTINPFVKPESVALIGVSTRTGPGSFNILEELIAYGYKGKIYPVNPKGGEILGVKTYTSITEVPDKPDVAVVSTPRTAVPEIVRQCTDVGIKAVIIITQGFSDADDRDGHQMHREIINIIKDTQTRIIGPNTLGVINNFNRFNTSFIPIESECSNVGVICQSGIFMAASRDFTGGIGLGIDIGNTGDLDCSDVLAYMGQDHRIKVINLHLEGLRDGRRFMEIMERVSSEKPVLVLKTGTSEVGAKAAGSHSGSLAGEDYVYGAALKQSGAIRVSDIDEMKDLTDTFSTYKSMHGKRIAIISISGGAGIIAIDAVSKNGLEVAEFSTKTIETLKEIFPPWMHPGNPADIWPAGMAKGYSKIVRQSMETILSDPGVDAALLITPAYSHPETDPLNVIDLVDDIAAFYPEKPVTAWAFGAYRKEYTTLFKEKGHVAAYPTADRAVRALAHLYDYLNRPLNRPKETLGTPDNINSTLVGGIIESNKISGTKVINEQSLDIMQAYGIPVVQSGTATTAEEAARKAEKLGFPVAMKVISPQVTHKSDAGGVKLNIRNKDEAIQAWREISTAVSRIAGARMLGVLIQPYRTGGTEVILGAKRDPQFGPVLLYGLGGIFTELLRDFSCRIAPVSPEEARQMIEDTRSAEILRGARGQEPADVDALTDTLVRLGHLITNHPEIKEMDINPVLVDSTGAVALDGRIMLSTNNKSPN